TTSRPTRKQATMHRHLLLALCALVPFAYCATTKKPAPLKCYVGILGDNGQGGLPYPVLQTCPPESKCCSKYKHFPGKYYGYNCDNGSPRCQDIIYQGKDFISNVIFSEPPCRMGDCIGSLPRSERSLRIREAASSLLRGRGVLERNRLQWTASAHDHSVYQRKMLHEQSVSR
ncbi:hypothetical protein PMAYCL1PPCAC_32699, partial [Pristionchus mayeri]